MCVSSYQINSDKSDMIPTESSPGLVTNVATPALKLSDFKLIAFDMDSTLINIECVDEIADAAGAQG